VNKESDYTLFKVFIFLFPFVPASLVLAVMLAARLAMLAARLAMRCIFTCSFVSFLFSGPICDPE
jgi:hypothetical protein